MRRSYCSSPEHVICASLLRGARPPASAPWRTVCAREPLLACLSPPCVRRLGKRHDHGAVFITGSPRISTGGEAPALQQVLRDGATPALLGALQTGPFPCPTANRRPSGSPAPSSAWAAGTLEINPRPQPCPRPPPPPPTPAPLQGVPVWQGPVSTKNVFSIKPPYFSGSC